MTRARRVPGRSDEPLAREQSTFVQDCLRHCGELKGGTALDLAGGVGRHSLPLAALGMTVVCADLDLSLLRRLRALQASSDVRGLYCAQIDARRALPFVERQFDLVLVVHYYAPGFLAAGVRL